MRTTARVFVTIALLSATIAATCHWAAAGIQVQANDVIHYATDQRPAGDDPNSWSDAELINRVHEYLDARERAVIPANLAIQLGRRHLDSSLDLLTGTLIRDYEQSVLPWDDEVALLMAVRGIAYLAERSDAAWEFLLSATSPVFWHNTITWISERSTREDAANRLTAAVIADLGLTGRPEVPGILEGLAAEEQEFVFRFAPVIVGAARRHTILTHEGREALLQQEGQDYKLNPDPWLQYPESTKWLEWQNRIRQQRREWYRENRGEARSVPTATP